MNKRMSLPDKGIVKAELIGCLKNYKQDDADWRAGRSWSLVYYAGQEHTELVKRAYNLYMSENAAGPAMFPSLRRLEAEVVSMILNLLGGSGSEAGSMTSGGTESILLAIRAYREQARIRDPGNTSPEILLPESSHPAVLKAAGYFGIKPVYIPLNSDFKADTSKLEELVTERTICMVASAPSFPHGVVDPIGEIGRIALKYGIGLHVDACLGSFLLPFLAKLGHEIPAFDFQVPGVTSISADLHKNGYSAKGASAILYRSRSLMRHQYFIDIDWPGGIYASPTIQGTRPGGAVAAAWASMMALGKSGYLELARRTSEATSILVHGIRSIGDLQILGNPDMNVLAFTSKSFNIQSVGLRLDAMGWYVNRINNPSALHMIVTPNHMQAIPGFLADLEKACEEEHLNPVSQGNASAVLYGGTEEGGSDDVLVERTLQRLDNLFRLDADI